MFPWKGQDEVDMVIGHELVDGFHEIKEPDKIEIRAVLLQLSFQFGPFCLVFFGDLYIVFVVHVDDVEPGFEEIEDGLDAIDGDRVFDVFEVGEQHYILS